MSCLKKEEICGPIHENHLDRRYDGGRWHLIKADDIPIILLVKEGSCIPHAPLAQCTEDIDWSRLEWRFYGTAPEHYTGRVSIPVNGSPITVWAEWDASSGKMKAADEGVDTADWTVIDGEAAKCF
ncbi:hypothetical protein AB6A23_24405 [Paenibacillus tarimensis]